MANRKWSLWMLLLMVIVCGCDAPQPSPSDTSSMAELAPGGPPSPGYWVGSDDGLLELRLSVVSRTVAKDESIQVAAQLPNKGQAPLTVLRPFGDEYAAKAVGMKIWHDQRRIPYTGANWTHSVAANGFAVIGAGEVVEDEIELTTDNYSGIEPPGIYTLRYDYSYDGQWDETAAVGNSGIRDAWRGTISSREVQVLKE
jgi:hypothetical protein